MHCTRSQLQVSIFSFVIFFRASLGLVYVRFVARYDSISLLYMRLRLKDILPSVQVMQCKVEDCNSSVPFHIGLMFLSSFVTSYFPLAA